MSPAVHPAGLRRRLVIVRHGVTAHNARGIWQGHLDSALTAEGLAQARDAAPALATYHPGVLLCSDLQRARDTAEVIAGELGLTSVRVDPRLREIHCGQWQGLETEVMLERYPEAPGLLAGTEDFRRGIDGETYAELGDRVGAAVADLLADLPERATAVLVTHGVTARALVGDLIGLDRVTSWSIFSGLGNCHWAELGEFAARWRLQGWNLRARFGG